MRTLLIGAGLAALLSSTPVAHAEPGKNDTFGKGQSSPRGAGETGSGLDGSDDSGSSDNLMLTRDRGPADMGTGPDGRGVHKPWLVGGSLETHHTVIRQDTAGANKSLNYFDLYGEWALTPYDAVGLESGAYQRFLADSGETGFRLDDVSAYYRRSFVLPERVGLQLTARITAPTSFESQKMGLITSPSIGARVDRRFGILTLDARIRGRAYIVKYRESQGGNPNPFMGARGAVQADLQMPFHTPLHFGAQAATGYTWYYDVSGADGVGRLPSGASLPMTNSTTDNQPVQQTYGGEIYVRYYMPAIGGVRTDIMAAFAQGDPTLGYTSLVHDGMEHFYFFNRRSSELYAALSAEY